MDISNVDEVSFLSHFSQVTDPRLEHIKHHNLQDILFLAICVVLCGANHCVAIADFTKAGQD